MKKYVVFLMIIFLASCSPAVVKSTGPKPLYEILTVQADGGPNIRFYEILSEPAEIKMLLGDEQLKDKIESTDTKTANFIILSMGEKPSSGYSIAVDSVVEMADKIVVTIKDVNPQPDEITASVITHPYTIVKINSKKPIEIK